MTDKVKLIYVYDPLCTWCYAFSPVLREFIDQHLEDFEVSVISGGMVRESNAGKLSIVAPFLKGSIPSIVEKTGIAFGEAFLENLEEGEMIMDSRPMSYALSIVKKHRPDQQFEFASLLQKSIYWDGKEPCDEQNLALLAEKIGIEPSVFSEEMYSEQTRYETNSDFQWVESTKLSGFPALIIEKKEELLLLAKGYTPIEHLNMIYNRILAGQ